MKRKPPLLFVRCSGLVLGLLLAAPQLFAQAAAGAPVRPLRSAAGHHPGLPALIGIGPAIVLIGAAMAAAILLLTVLIRRENALSAFADRCALRLEGRRLGLFFWGLAELIAILFILALLMSVHAGPIISGIVLIAALALGGFAIAVAALFIGRRGVGELATDAGQIGGGFAVLVFAAAVPFIGWAFALVIMLASLGAVTEALVARPRQAEPAPLTGLDDRDG